jgi:hypothetical protein
MPFGFTEDSAKQVVQTHMNPRGEQALAILPLTRKLLSITDRGRVLLVNFPFFGQSKILKAFHASDITDFDYNSTGSKIVVAFDAGNKTETFKVIMTPFFNPSAEARKFEQALLSQNPSAKPRYLEPDETVVATTKTAQGLCKFTDKNIYLVSPSRRFQGKFEITSKTPLSSVREFDFYPTAWDSLVLYFTLEDGRALTLKIGAGTMMMSLMSGGKTDIDAVSKAVLGAMEKHGARPRAPYLGDIENVITTLRVAQSRLGVVSPGQLLRVTNYRMIELEPDGAGKPQLKRSISFQDVARAKVTRYLDQYGAVSMYCLRLRTNDGVKHKFWTDAKYDYAIDKIRDLISGIEPEPEEFE